MEHRDSVSIFEADEWGKLLSVLVGLGVMCFRDAIGGKMDAPEDFFYSRIRDAQLSVGARVNLMGAVSSISEGKKSKGTGALLMG